jgi:endonuclease/exonuclease/phosphatase family metal-dependent hydrolase
MAAEINGTWIINIYAPSGAEKRMERESAFFTTDVPVLMSPARRDMILAEDFNSTIDKHNSTSQNNTSRALATLIRRFALCDVWDTAPNRTGYTYYASKSASRIDRVYVTARLYPGKQE